VPPKAESSADRAAEAGRGADGLDPPFVFDVRKPSPQSPPSKYGWAWRVFEKFRNGG